MRFSVKKDWVNVLCNTRYFHVSWLGLWLEEECVLIVNFRSGALKFAALTNFNKMTVKQLLKVVSYREAATSKVEQ